MHRPPNRHFHLIQKTLDAVKIGDPAFALFVPVNQFAQMQFLFQVWRLLLEWNERFLGCKNQGVAVETSWKSGARTNKRNIYLHDANFPDIRRGCSHG